MFDFWKKSGPPEIRRLSTDHAAECARLHAPAFAHGWDTSEFESLLTSGIVLAEGAFSGKSALAGICLSRCAADEAEILTLVVAASMRHKGIGRLLLMRHMEHLAARGIMQLFLEVESGNQPALKLYRTLGFLQVGERRAYTRMKDGTLANALILRRSLA